MYGSLLNLLGSRRRVTFLNFIVSLPAEKVRLASSVLFLCLPQANGVALRILHPGKRPRRNIYRRHERLRPQRFCLFQIPRDVVHVHIKNRVVMRLVPQCRDVPGDATGLRRDHRCGTHRLDFPIEKLLIKFLCLRGVLASDFKMHYRASHASSSIGKHLIQPLAPFSFRNHKPAFFSNGYAGAEALPPNRSNISSGRQSDIVDFQGLRSTNQQEARPWNTCCLFITRKPTGERRRQRTSPLCTRNMGNSETSSRERASSWEAAN